MRKGSRGYTKASIMPPNTGLEEYMYDALDCAFEKFSKLAKILENSAPPALVRLAIVVNPLIVDTTLAEDPNILINIGIELFVVTPDTVTVLAVPVAFLLLAGIAALVSHGDDGLLQPDTPNATYDASSVAALRVIVIVSAERADAAAPHHTSRF